MDIRNFFGKQPAKKKPAASKASSKESPEKKRSGSIDAASPKRKSEDASSAQAFTKRKRKPIVEEEEEAVEISPQDFFATSSKSDSKSPKKKPIIAASEAKTTPVRSSPRKKTKRRTVVDDSDEDEDDNDSDEVFVDTKFANDEETDEEFELDTKSARRKNAKDPPRTPPSTKTSRHFSPQVAAKSSPSTPASSSKKRKAPTSSAKKKATPEAKPTVHLVDPSPELEKESFDEDAIQVSECMSGLTFVFTGNMPDLNREDALEKIKILGGRVTTAVSGKTNYLVVGPVLEDGRNYQEGSKYKKAISYDGKVKLVMGAKQLYGLCHYYHDRAMKERGITPKPPNTSTTNASAAPSPPAPPSNPYAKKPAAPVSNPYTKKGPVSNPYAKKAPTNPYAKKAPANPYAKKTSSNNPYAKSAPNSATAPPSSSNSESMLWVDRHKPVHTREILGNATNVKKLQDWLRTWESNFNNAKSANKSFTNPRGPWKAALLSGPPGIGSKYRQLVA